MVETKLVQDKSVEYLSSLVGNTVSIVTIGDHDEDDIKETFVVVEISTDEPLDYSFCGPDWEFICWLSDGNKKYPIFKKTKIWIHVREDDKKR